MKIKYPARAHNPIATNEAKIIKSFFIVETFKTTNTAFEEQWMKCCVFPKSSNTIRHHFYLISQQTWRLIDFSEVMILLKFLISFGKNFIFVLKNEIFLKQVLNVPCMYIWLEVLDTSFVLHFKAFWMYQSESKIRYFNSQEW